MATIYRSIVLNLTPNDLWKKVADVGSISELLEVVSQSEVAGDERSCVLADGAKLSEKIVSVDETHRRVAYTITASPFPLSFHASSMQVEAAAEGRSKLTWITDLAPDAMAEPFTSMIEGELSALKVRFT